MIERERFALVENRQVVVGMGGQPDHIAHRQQRAAAGEPFAGGGLEFVQGGRDDDAGGQAVVLT